MGILARYNLHQMIIPSKVYVHTTGKELFEREHPTGYFQSVVDEHRNRLADSPFLIGIIWGDTTRGHKVADIFGYEFDDVSGWEGNPEVRNWIFRDGIYEADAGITCGEGLMILGAEEGLRRSTQNFQEYMLRAPDILALGLPIEGHDDYLARLGTR